MAKHAQSSKPCTSAACLLDAVRLASDPRDANLVYTGTGISTRDAIFGTGSLSMTVAGLRGGAATAFVYATETDPASDGERERGGPQRGLWNHISKKASTSFSM